MGLCVFYLGREFAVWLTVRNVHGFLAFLDNVVAGIAAGAVVLLYERGRQRGVDKLRESEQRFRLVANAAPVLIWMSGTDKLCTYFNKPWLDFTGRSMEKELGTGWTEGVHSEDLQGSLDTYTKSFDRREQFSMKYRLRRHDGTFRWILSIGVPRFNEDRSFAGYIGIGLDVTDRELTEEALRKSEEKFSKAFRESPVAFTLTSATDFHYLDVNETFERLSGWRRDEVIGRTPFDFNIWINPEQRNELVERIRSDGSVRNAEIRYRCKDGTERVGLVSAELIEIDGESCIVATIADITERKQAEVALSGVSRRLIEAQEQERARIGRELHDDINQRLAMLAIELEQLQANPSGVQTGLDELRRQTIELSNDVQALSHELHSSKLEYLGAVPGIKSWCREFSERQKMEIDFKSDVSTVVPFEVGICLFRVLQESLHNAVKYSGVKRIEVQLREVHNEIHLTVTDRGRGFDVEAAIQGHGLGLTSMQERVRLLNGSMSIQSKPMVGTTIHVRVPFGSEDSAQRAAGVTIENVSSNGSKRQSHSEKVE